MASFKSASDFMGPGGGDNGLSALARGLGQLSGAMFEIGIKDRQERQQIALLEDVQNFRRSSDQFMTDFMANNQGANAGEASAAYQAWSAENFIPLRDKWAAVSPESEYYIVQHAGGIVTGGLDSMLGYQRGQTEKWYDSTYNAEVARVFDLATRPGTPQEQIDQALGELNTLTRAHYGYKGLDSGAAEVKANQLSREVATARTLSTFNDLLKTDPGAAAAFVDEGMKPQDGGSLTAPLEGSVRVSSPFGLRNRPTPGASKDHQGIDYAVPAGTQVKAVGAGVVEFVGKNKGYGLQVRIKHDDGTVSLYSHLSDTSGLQQGMTVDQGQTVALSGGVKGDPNAGVSTGPHLDFRIKVNGQFVNPDSVLGGQPKTQLSSLFTPEQLAEMRAKAVQAQDDHFVKNMTGGIAQAFQNGTEVEIASSINQAFGEIKKAGDPDRQNSMMRSLQQNISFYQTGRDAADMEGTEKFLSETEDLSPLDRKNKLKEWEGLSRKAREDLGKKIDEGTVNKTTPENQEAFDRIRETIDDRRNAGEPMSDKEVKALAQQHGLTTTQAKGAEDYRSQGGMAGVDGFAGKVNAIYQELGRSNNKVPSGFLDLVARNLPPGKTATPEELRGVVIKLMYDEIKGESTGRVWDTSETYPESARRGRDQKWQPNIVDDEEKAELTLEIKARIEAGEFPDKPITDDDLRDYKRVYKMNLPPRPNSSAASSIDKLPDLQGNLGR